MILAETYMDSDNKTSRRSFLTGAAAGVCAFDIIPGSVFAQPAPSDRIHFGHIGIGGRGSGFLRAESGGPTKPGANLGGAPRQSRDARRRPSEAVQRFPAPARRQGCGRRFHRHSRSLACPHGHHGLRSRQGCLRGEAGLPHHRRGPRHGAGRRALWARRASGLAGALTARGVSRLRLHSQWPDRHGAESHLLALRQSNRRLDARFAAAAGTRL